MPAADWCQAVLPGRGVRRKRILGSGGSFSRADNLEPPASLPSCFQVVPGFSLNGDFADASTLPTNCHPNRPLMHRWPLVTSCSMGDVAFKIWFPWTWSWSVQPTPQYGQMVSVTFCRDGSQAPAALKSCSVFAMRAPVGQTPIQFPQKTQAD